MGESVKLTTTADREAGPERALSGLLLQWANMKAEWERRLNVVAVTPMRAAEIAATWAAWVAADMSRLERDGEDASLFETGPEAKLMAVIERRNGRNEDRDSRRARALARHADEAARLCNVTIAEETRAVLIAAMLPVVCRVSSGWP